MRSLERKFKYVEMRNPFWSSFTCFAHTVHGQRFTKRIIREHFGNLVDKEEYAKDEKCKILKYLYQLSYDTL